MKKYLFFALLLLIASTLNAQNMRDKHTLTVKYLYADSLTMAAPDSILKLDKGERYRIVSPMVEGFTPDKELVEGCMPDEDLTDTVTYQINVMQTYGVFIDPAIAHGRVTASPDSDVAVGDTVVIVATPDEFYDLEALRAFNQEDETVEVEIKDDRLIMPDFDVMVTAVFNLQLPVITGEIEAPQICAGNALELSAPEVANAEEQGWQMAPKSNFENAEAYLDQVLDASYNGWKLRYFATNATGTVYSNVVTIKVHQVLPILTGEASLCTLQTGTYTASGVSGADLIWTVSDPQAVVQESGKTIMVLWHSSGEQTVSLEATNAETGCSATVSMTVNVQSFVSEDDIHALVAKKDNGREYLLIYPNPQDGYKYQWYKDGTSISGANQQYYYKEGGLDTGAYQVYVSFNADANGKLFGGLFTDVYVVSSPATLNVRPNPASAGSEILVLNESGEETVVSLYALDGRLLHQQTMNAPMASLTLNLPQGLYLVRLTDAQGNQSTEKLIIQ